MLAQYYKLRDSFHVVLDIDDCVYPKVDILGFQREFFVAMESILIGFVDILEEITELLDKLSK